MPATIQDAFASAKGRGPHSELLQLTLEGLHSQIADATEAGEIPPLVGPQLQDRVTALANSIAMELVAISPTETVAEAEAIPVEEAVAE